MLDGLLSTWPSRALFLSVHSYVCCSVTADENVNKITSEIKFIFTLTDALLMFVPYFKRTLHVVLLIYRDEMRSPFG